MKRNITLTVSSVLSILLFIVHIADDVARGIDTYGFVNLIGMSVFVLWLYGTLVLGDRRSGYVIMLLGSLFGMLGPVSHMINGISRTLTDKPDGALFFVFTMWALAVAALFSLVLSVRGLWRREWARDQAPSAKS